MRLAVSYTPYDTYSKEKTDNIITFAHFEEGDLLSETHDDTESSDKYNDDSIMTPLLSEEEINMVDSGDEYEDELRPTYILEDICDSCNSHLRVDRREACYKYVIALNKNKRNGSELYYLC